jgi:hypothetical protein
LGSKYSRSIAQSHFNIKYFNFDVYDNSFDLPRLIVLYLGITSWIWPSTIVTASGVLLMGIIQVYLSVHLYIHNVLVLAGDKSIDKKTIDDITSIINKEPFVISVNSIIGVMVDS